MSWDYEYEKTVKFLIREKLIRPEKFMCPLSFADIIKDMCHGVDTCLECHSKYYPGGRSTSWIGYSIIFLISDILNLFVLPFFPTKNLFPDYPEISCINPECRVDNEKDFDMSICIASCYNQGGRNGQ